MIDIEKYTVPDGKAIAFTMNPTVPKRVEIKVFLVVAAFLVLSLLLGLVFLLMVPENGPSTGMSAGICVGIVVTTVFLSRKSSEIDARFRDDKITLLFNRQRVAWSSQARDSFTSMPFTSFYAVALMGQNLSICVNLAFSLSIPLKSFGDKATLAEFLGNFVTAGRMKQAQADKILGAWE